MTEPRIELHKDKGVNPKLTFCPRCGGEGPDIILLGANEKRWESINPAQPGVFIGKKYEAAKHFGTSVRQAGVVGEHERLPGSLCKGCETELEEHKALVEAGGIYWKCEDCPANGVIKASAPLAGMVREQMKVPAPAPCGVSFTKDDCPACGPSATKQEGSA